MAVEEGSGGVGVCNMSCVEGMAYGTVVLGAFPFVEKCGGWE